MVLPRRAGEWNRPAGGCPPALFQFDSVLWLMPRRNLLDALDLHEVPGVGLGVGGLDVGSVTDGVADVVELDQAADALIGHAGQSSQNVGGLGGTGSLDGFQSGEVGVIAHGGDGGDHVVAAVVGLGVGVGVDPLLDAKTNNGGNDMVSAVTAMGYDAYFTALEALKAAGSIDPAAVLEALPGVTYEGVCGFIQFDDIGDAIRDQAYIKTANTEAGIWEFVAVQGVA